MRQQRQQAGALQGGAGCKLGCKGGRAPPLPAACAAALAHSPRVAPPPQEFDAFLEALAPLLGRLSYAFSRIVLVCEGSPGFQAQARQNCIKLACAFGLLGCTLPLQQPGKTVDEKLPGHRPPPQVLCGTERLLALGRRVGLQLQCHACTGGGATAAVVAATVRAELARWQALDPALQYSVPEDPSQEEAFLTR